MAQQIVSKQFSLRKEDYKRWARNALLFSGPAVLVLLANLRELIPQNAAYGALLVALYGLTADLFRKWLNENRY